LCDLFVCPASAPEAFGVLLRGCGDVEQDDHGKDQQDTDPSESASHDSNFDWFLSTGERRSALKTRPIWHTIRKIAVSAAQVVANLHELSFCVGFIYQKQKLNELSVVGPTAWYTMASATAIFPLAS
jgi:hypothetical protein